MTRRKSLILSLAAVPLLALVAVVCVLLWANSGAGRAYAVRSVVDAMASPEQSLTIEGHEGSLLSEIRLSGVTLADADGAWLRAGSARLLWRPSTLLTGTLTVDELVIEDLAVLRAPLPGAESEPSDEALEIPSLPVEIVIGNLLVADVTLDKSLLGTAASFRITGSAGTEQRETLRSALTLERSDGVPGRLQAKATYAPGSDRLTLDLQVAEPAGGLAARLLDLPDLPPVSLTLRGDGTLTKWPGTLEADLQDLLRVEATIGLARIDDGLRAVVDAKATPAAALADQTVGLPWSLLAGGLDLTLDLVAQEDNRFELSALALESPAVMAAVTAQLDLDDETVDAKGDITLRDPAAIADALAPLSLAGANAQIRASGALLQPEIALTLVANGLSGPDLSVEGITADLALTPDPGATSGGLRGSGQITGISLEPKAATEALLGPEIDWSLAGSVDLQTLRADIERFTLEAATVGLGAVGQADLEAGDMQFDIDGNLSDLSALQSIVGLPVEGALRLSAQVDGRDFGATLTTRLEGQADALALGEPIATALLGPAPKVAADVILDAEGSLSIQTARIEGAASLVTGDLRLDLEGETLEGQVDARLDALAPLSDPLGTPLEGALSVTAQVSGALADPTIEATLDGTALNVADVALGAAQVVLQLSNAATAPSGSLQAELPGFAGGLTSDLNFQLQDTLLSISALRLQAPSTEAEGEIALQLDSGLAEGTLALNSTDLGPWLAFAGLPGDGRLEAEARLSAASGRQGASLSGSAQDLVLNDGETPLRLAKAEFSVTASDIAALQADDLSVTVSGLEAGTVSLTEASLRGSGGQTGLDFNLAARGQAVTAFDLVGEGRFAADDDGLTLTLARLSGSALQQPVSLTSPLSLASGSAGSVLSGLDLTFGQARLSGDAQLSGQALAADLSIEALSLDLLAAVAPDLPVGGVLTSQVQIAGTPTNPSGTATLQLREITLAKAKDLPPLSADLTADWQSARLDLDLTLEGFAGEAARVEATLPLALDPESFAPVVSDTAPISGQVTWQGDLQEVMPLVPAADQIASGPASLALTASGSLADPRLSGDLTLDGARFENLDTGTVLTDLNLTIALEGERATLARLEAGDGGDGRLSGSGYLDIEPDTDFPFELALTFEDFMALRRDDMKAQQRGELSIKGTIQEALLSGALTIEPVEIQISNDLPPEVVDLQVVEVNNSAVGKEDPKETDPADTGPVIDLDLQIDMPKRVYVRGLGLESEWGGAFAITGDSSAPQIDGKLSVIRGQLSLLGRVFQLTRGSVGLASGGEIDPELDIEAQNQRGDLTATVLVTGRASKPELTLTSVPELPQDEILARVLFDKSTSELSTFEAVQLAEAVASFTTGSSGSSGVLDLARDTLGLDVLRVESGEGASAGPAVSAGQYVADGVYVGVKQGAQPGSSSVGVEVELTPNISVKSDVGQSGESDIGVRFRWDY